MGELPNQAIESSSPPQASVIPSERDWRTPLWRRCLYWFINNIYFQRITVTHPDWRSDEGPVLYLGLHRNGAVDGFVYHSALSGPAFMISTQLRKNWLSRLFFDGIAVTRTKDEGDHSVNAAALRQCLDHLHAGGKLCVFPEGTSSLGPRHLPFKGGAVWLLLDYLEAGGPPLRVVPVGIHYECAWAFRAKVEVVTGPPLSLELPPDSSRTERLRIMKRRVQAALEAVGINVPSDQGQETVQCLAYVATLGTPRSYFASMKALERGVPEQITAQWRALEPDLRQAGPWLHQGVPLFPVGPMALYVLALVLIGPVVAAAILLNSPGLCRRSGTLGENFPTARMSSRFGRSWWGCRSLVFGSRPCW